MQKILEKAQQNIQEQEINNLSFDKIEKFYLNKNHKSRFGLEYERLSLDKKTLKNAPYEKMEKIIIDFSKIVNWELVFDNETIIGAKDSIGNSVSLEPGCQMEISLKPEENILDIDLNLSKYVDLLDKIADIYDVFFFGYGISPLSNVDEIELLNKRRYKIMNNYLPNCQYGELCPKMMRQTAGIQVNIDYESNIDAYNKMKFLNLIMPFVSALYSNSPIENNNIGDYKSKRSQVWQFTGSNRCNLFYKNIFKGFRRERNIFKNYIKAVCDVPMIFIERNDKIISIEGKINFNQYMKEGYEGHYATMEDYILHQSLCFPDVRLKNHIEIRNHDSADCASALALCAFYKGLMIQDIEKLLNEFSYLKIEKIDEYFKQAVKNGLDFNIEKTNNKNKKDGWEVVSELYKKSISSLSAKEKTYLNPIFDMIRARKTKADVLIDNGFKSASDVVEYYLK